MQLISEKLNLVSFVPEPMKYDKTCNNNLILCKLLILVIITPKFYVKHLTLKIAHIFHISYSFCR